MCPESVLWQNGWFDSDAIWDDEWVGRGIGVLDEGATCSSEITLGRTCLNIISWFDCNENEAVVQLMCVRWRVVDSVPLCQFADMERAETTKMLALLCTDCWIESVYKICSDLQTSLEAADSPKLWVILGEIVSKCWTSILQWLISRNSPWPQWGILCFHFIAGIVSSGTITTCWSHQAPDPVQST